MNINKTYYNKTRTKKISKSVLYIFILLSILVCCFYEHYNYSKLLDNFKTNFNNYKFSEANNLLLTRQNFNPFKLFLANKDVSKYFNNKINTLSNDMENKKISPEDALLQLKEIERYNIISDDELHNISISINLIKDSNKNYTDALNYFNNGQYVEAISCLKKVSALDLDYPESLLYIDKSKSALKDSLFNYCDTLVDNDHYTEALSKISDNNNILGDDADIEEKITDIKAKQQEYLDKNSAVAEASSRALTTSISPSNINTLNIQSDTSYLINVNIKNQKTYIYKGKADNWKLVKTYSCSTGITGEDTPSGSFSIKEKGDWFFSEKYNEGGKYWTQITGDILFHSVPFDKDKTTVLDYTMNKPSSHGCIRLALDDAKWIYNNIPKGSKVIIK
ncbi:L,D-transpeptidase [uncultured Clostridium sp.]|uniref:L,D-transpeptidase n=1 Tax=uncultured Clostridium sp. TaxID=59620 RepID=UPI0028E4ECA9|nr:L,D-transpeptidase [uncultured Clostridium sp.]